VKRTLQISLRTTVVTLVLTGILYPYAITGVAQILFPFRANGSLLTDGQGNVIGSELIAQQFENPAYFQPRPSAAGQNGYDGVSSSGSNLGPTSKKLRDRVDKNLKRLREQNPEPPGAIPIELVTASASGLDPDLPPDGARWQVPRIARARHVAPQRIEEILDANVQKREFGFVGEPRVNVLLLNLALDRALGRPPDFERSS
jgi:K+-transporting ATPase ATPase C chain